MEERRRTFILLLGLYMFLYMLVKHVVEHSNIDFAKRMGEVSNFELGL
jgi:hypothetical protein